MYLAFLRVPEMNTQQAGICFGVGVGANFHQDLSAVEKDTGVKGVSVASSSTPLRVVALRTGASLLPTGLCL